MWLPAVTRVQEVGPGQHSCDAIGGCTMPSLLLPGSLESSMWFCSVIFQPHTQLPQGLPETCFSLEDVSSSCFPCFIWNSWITWLILIMISQQVPRYLLHVHMPCTWGSSFCSDLGWQVENWTEPLGPCLAFDHLSWEECPALTFSPCPFVFLSNFLSPLLQTCCWADLPSGALQTLAGANSVQSQKK